MTAHQGPLYPLGKGPPRAARAERAEGEGPVAAADVDTDRERPGRGVREIEVPGAELDVGAARAAHRQVRDAAGNGPARIVEPYLRAIAVRRQLGGRHGRLEARRPV